jgi:hypothetical protein
MKTPISSSHLKTALLIVQLVWCFGGPTVAQAGDKDPSPGPVRPGNWNYRSELPQGYLEVYSATDKFKDGNAWYFPHSSYAIYTIDGKLFKNVKNHRSATDEIPEVVALPVGTYTVAARTDKDGYGHALVVIKEGQQAILDWDVWEMKTQRSVVHN